MYYWNLVYEQSVTEMDMGPFIPTQPIPTKKTFQPNQTQNVTNTDSIQPKLANPMYGVGIFYFCQYLHQILTIFKKMSNLQCHQQICY